MDRIPLYNKDKKIYMIHKDNLYERILYDHYRIVDENFYKNSNQKIPELENFNWSILPDIYYKLFYNSFIKTNHITDCLRPSYDGMFKHIKPYYTLDELNYLAEDWNIKTSNNTELNITAHGLELCLRRAFKNLLYTCKISNNCRNTVLFFTYMKILLYV